MWHLVEMFKIATNFYPPSPPHLKTGVDMKNVKDALQSIPVISYYHG